MTKVTGSFRELKTKIKTAHSSAFEHEGDLGNTILLSDINSLIQATLPM
jgi:hypothetical protein